MPWYSGSGITRAADALGDAVRDVRRVRRGWHWDSPRPRTWPEQGSVVPAPASDLGWARQEPVRTIRFLIQRGLLLPFTEAMAHPKVEGREWVRDLERPVIFAANHSSHADTSLILHALGDRARDRTVVAAAADYWFKRPLLGNIVSLFLNTFPFSRTGGAQAQLHSSSQLLKSGWNLVLFPRGAGRPTGASRSSRRALATWRTKRGLLSSRCTSAAPTRSCRAARACPCQALCASASVSRWRQSRPRAPGSSRPGWRKRCGRWRWSLRSQRSRVPGSNGGA
jgi:hypothetical protein